MESQDAAEVVEIRNELPESEIITSQLLNTQVDAGLPLIIFLKYSF